MGFSGNPESGLRVFPSAPGDSVGQVTPLRRAGADPGGEGCCGVAVPWGPGPSGTPRAGFCPGTRVPAAGARQLRAAQVLS